MRLLSSLFHDHQYRLTVIRSGLYSAWFGVAITISGCGTSDTPVLAPVSGKVTREGEPVSDAMVIFTPAKGSASSGTTDSQGRFELRYFDGQVGAAVGSHRVKVTTGNPGKPLQPGDPPRPMLEPPEDILMPEAFEVRVGENSFQLPLPPKKKGSART
ncbi:carboxypeptidase-like regulatory domain-containing protein [Planctopirus hydrillae]|uniref:carboxypeptidase-like regulatory domain-containing protein n=1 Tax=Planctopirus hydrillae TaxID=1841610 RepID=UPI001041CBD0|nr:carboxypeptidase-like regulatory domain-containing protein [Planctopirus hydrillae]